MTPKIQSIFSLFSKRLQLATLLIFLLTLPMAQAQEEEELDLPPEKPQVIEKSSGKSGKRVRKVREKKPIYRTRDTMELMGPPKPEKTIEKKLIETNITVSEWFDQTADTLDVYLAGGKRLTGLPNETNVWIENSSYVVEGQNPTNSTNVGVNLRLPNVEQYWNLKFTNYDESKERGVQGSRLRQEPRERSYGATLGLFKKLGNVRTSFNPRIDLQSPIKVSHSLVFESLADQKTYLINPKIQFFANPDQGTGIFNAINFQFILSKIFTLAFINEGEYQDRIHLYTETNGLDLGQILTKTMGMNYGIFFTSINQPNYHLEAYTLSVGFSHMLYKKILDYQISPQLNFQKPKEFRGTPGISFHIKLNF